MIEDTPAAVAMFVRGRGQHVLFIDDEVALATAMSRLLRMLGYRCTVYFDPVLAVSAFRADPKQFDVVIADINMPGLSGIDVAQAVRAIRPHMPIALSSGRINQEILDRASSLGFDVWLPKPATVDELCQTLDGLLQTPRPDSCRIE